MTNYTITGRTFPHRDLLKAWRAQWDGAAWTLANPSSAMLDTLRRTPGLVVTEQAAPAPREPEPAPSFADLAASIGAARRTIVSNRRTVLYGDDASFHNAFADQNPIVHFGFSSLRAYTNHIEHRTRTNSSGHQAGAAFTGTVNMREALALARNGWREGVDRAAAIVEHIGVRHAVQRRRKHAVAGGSVNVGRMLAGNPAHMRQRPKLPGRRVVTLFVETGANAIISVDAMTMRAAVVAAVADVMEQNGYSCEIVATDSSLWRGQCYMQLAVRLKAAGARLNLSDVVFGLGHPSMIRRFSFAAVDSAPELQAIHEIQGSATDLFTNDAPPPRNSYYVRHVRDNLHADDALGMLRAVFPDGLE